MTFLNPAVLFGLLTASIPVIIHLLNLRRLKKIDFSTLSFLKELQKNKIRRVKIKQWLLLALRVLIILLIVGAFARPALEGINIGGTTSAAKTTALFILDDTFSMSAISQKGSYFNQAKQAIKNILQNMEEGDEAGLLLISGDQEGGINLTSNIQSLADRLEIIPISGSSGTINSALIKAAGIIGESKNFNKEIYLLTDFQINRTAVDENIVDLGQLLNSQVKLYSLDFSDRELNNFSIDKLEVDTKIFEKNKPVTFEATITNNSDKQALNLVTSLFIGSKRSAQKSIDISSHESKNILLEGTVENPGQSDVFVEIEDDEIMEDNKRFTSINFPERYSILILYDELSDANFINLALQSARSDESLGITLKPADKIKSVRVEDFNIIILITDELNSTAADLNKFVNNGGGLVIYPSAKASLESVNNLLNSFKLPAAAGIVEGDVESNSQIDFDKIDIEHPLLQNIFKDGQKKAIESPVINKYIKISVRGEGKSIITLLDGSTFLSEYNCGKGKILVYNVCPVLQWSDFPVKSIFAPLVYKSVIYLSSIGNGDFKIIAGEPLNFNISKRTSPQLKIVLPDKSEELINLNGTDTDFIHFTKTFQTGNYKLYSGEKLLETASVNTDPVESNVNYISDSEFDDYLNAINFKGIHLTIAKDTNPSEIILQARFGSELWRYFLIASFVLALVEMAISRAAKKELVEIDK